MGRSRTSTASRLRSGHRWLRSRGPVTLAAALLLQVSAGTAQNGTGAAGLLRAALLVVLLLGVLIAATVDSLLTSGAQSAVRAGASVRRWTRVSVLGLPEPLALSSVALLDRTGKPLRGGARNARLALLQREHAQQTYARSVRGRAEVALAELRRIAQPLSRRIARAGLALESRVLAARATLIARGVDAAAWIRPRATRALALAWSRTAVLWQTTRARVVPVAARANAAARAFAAGLLRQSSLIAWALLRATSVGLASSRAVLAAVPIPSVPLPSMSTRTVRVVSLGVLMSFVFATVIGTTGLVATRGSVALGASTTLAIISGEVSVMDEGATDFQAAVDGQVLGAGSTVQTGADSYAVLTYFEGSTVSIDPNTVLVIEALEANRDGSTIIGMRQDLGRTWHSVTTLLTAGSKYEVKTPTATATVRGTSFLVGVQRSADVGLLPETVIETTEGAVAAEREPTPETPEGEEIIVPAGFQVRSVEAAPIPPPVPAPEPERKVTVTVDAENSVVVDPQGRANGEVNGRIVVQTPGATVERVDGRLVVTLPNTTDGKITTVVRPEQDEEEPEGPRRRVRVQTVVEERGRGESRVEETIELEPEGGASGVTGVEVSGGTDQSAPPDVRQLEESEKEAPRVKVSEVPAAEMVALALGRVDDRGPDRSGGERQGGGGGGDGDEEGDDGEAAGGEGQGGGSDGDQGSNAGAGSSGDGDDEGDEDGDDRDGDDGEEEDRADRRGIVNSIVTLTLPPLSADEVARREQQKRDSEERERRENERRDERRREEEQKKVAELRRQEAEARAQAERLGGQRQQEEGRRDVRREDEDRRGEEERRKEERQGNAPPAPVALLQQVLRAVAPADGETRRDEDQRVNELKKQEEEARRAAEKAAEELRQAEKRLRDEAIKAEEEKRREAEKRAEELRNAEERAKQDEARKKEELRRIEEKAREQAAKLADEQRREAERRLEQFREAEEKKRRDETNRLEDQRRAEERARDESERKLRELRRQEEQARERERERQGEEDREEDREESERRDRGGFVPKIELKAPPGIGTRTTEDADRSEQRRERREERSAEREERDS